MKLLELVKTYDEFKGQRPPLDEPRDSNEVSSGPGTAGESSLESATTPPERGPVRTLTHSPDELGIDTGAPSQVAGQEQPDADILYGEALRAVSSLFEAAGLETVSPGRLHAAAREMEQFAAALAAQTARDDSLLGLALGTYPEGKGFVLPHSVNVASLAAFVGHRLEVGENRLARLVLAGLTHDIGNVRIPSGLLYKEEPLAPGELDEVKKRPIHSNDLITSLGGDFEQVGEIALQVYERLDGSGYPKGVRGDQILLEARILGAVDFFETTIHPRPYKDSPPGSVNFGIQTLMRMAAQFGQDVLKALVRSVGLFPVGTYVALSTGEIARVLMGSRDNPMRPVVEVVLDKRNQRAEPPRRIDLVASPHLYVSKPLSDAELAEFHLLDMPQAAGDGATRERRR